MNITTFLKKSTKGKLTVTEQLEFLEKKQNIKAEELALAVDFLMSKVTKKLNIKNAIDICGTGGSGLERINTSTISAFILASAGIQIAKHGNKAASGRFGSFDLLENMEIDISNNSAKNLNFLYARDYHPSMKYFADARSIIKTPTFFNQLGPLLNPAQTKIQIIGTPFKNQMMLIAETCKLIGKEKVYVISGEDSLDEVTITGKTFVTELNKGKIKNYAITPEDFGITKSDFNKIKGGSGEKNTEIALQILKNKCKTKHLDLVLVNCALALKLVNKTKTLKEGYALAKSIIENGKAFQKYEEIKTPNILKKIVAKIPKLKKSERDFYGAIKIRGVSLIAEIKRKSPSAGTIGSADFSPSKIAKNYEKSGADAISVVCEKNFFNGSLKYMNEASKSTNFIPILCKDFIIYEYQIYDARRNGADAILLIASLLNEKEINKFTAIAESLNMNVLIEVHTNEELEKVLKTSVKIIGINNRNLNTFKIDLQTTAKIAKNIPKDRLIVSESGIHTKTDLLSMPKNINAILVGTSLMNGTPMSELSSPKIKICGVRTTKVAKFCEKIGVDFIGLNFVKTSKRKITNQTAQKIINPLHNTKTVGIFQNQDLSEVNKLSKNLNYIQLCGNESIEYIKKCRKPVIKTIQLNDKKNIQNAQKYYPHVAYIFFDGAVPGNGKTFDHKLLKEVKHPFFISGGINIKNINLALNNSPVGIDIATGVETNGEIDTKKIQEIINKLQSKNEQYKKIQHG